MTFKDFHLHPELITGIETMGFEKPTPVQEKVIPFIIDKKDVIACAQTGTGKTAAFLIPVIHDILENPTGKIHTLIIVPTRELTVQIDQQLQGLGYFASISSKPVYGGGDGSGWELEKAALTKGCDVIIATPGKLLQHLTMGYVVIDDLKTLILDEADRMLDMGFHEDILRIIEYLPKERQNLLFSATMPPKIRTLAKEILNDPLEVTIALSRPAEGVIQAAYLVHDKDKITLLNHLLHNKNLTSVLIFASTKVAVKKLEVSLKEISLSARAMHSDLDQQNRERTLLAFRNRDFEILIATDILARGIDIDKIDLVINYNVPQDPEDYVHRIGRTARAEESGLAITLINQMEVELFKRIERFIGNEIYKLPLPGEVISGPDYFKQNIRSSSPRRGRPPKKR